MDTSSDLSTKRIRKGTKSCVECRQRKIRCIWETEIDRVCTGCKTRQRRCVPQVYQQRPTNTTESSRADRIERLERQIARIAAAVQRNDPIDSHPSTSSSTSPAVEDITADQELEGPATTPPAHLRFLFDNSLIAPSRQRGDTQQQAIRPPCSPKYLAQARAKLQHVMPCEEDVRAAAGYGTAWMQLHQSLFATPLQFGSSEVMIERYQDQLLPDAQIVDIASFLLAFAITVRQVPPGEQRLTLKDVPKYVQEVLHAVESTIVSHSGIASTVEGLTTTVLYLRLQLGFGQIKQLWLTLRRTIALAELIGLPRTWTSHHLESQRTDIEQIDRDPRVIEKAALWEAICATDRLSSMMFNLPVATATHKFPRRQILNSTGIVLSQPYLLELAGIAMRVQELDESHTSGQPKNEVYTKVLNIDSDIQSLKSSTPRIWWEEGHGAISGDHLVQFWHFYLLLRTHIHSAMDQDEHEQYKYSRIVCSDACRSLAQRYGYVRRNLPPGFFICRIIDMQIFSAAIFLVLSCFEQISTRMRQAFSLEDENEEAVRDILNTMESVSDQVSGDFAREASAAVKSLMTLLRNPAVDTSSSQGLTLRIPLLGNIHITTTRQQTDQTPRQLGLDQFLPTTASHIPTVLPAIASEPSNSFNDQANGVPWFMELDMDTSSLQDPFITDDYFGEWDQLMMNFNSSL